MGGVPSGGLWAGVGSALGAGRLWARTRGWRRKGRPISPLFSASRALPHLFSWFEFFSPLHPLHVIFSSAFATRHEVMVIGGGQGGRGSRLQGGWVPLMDRIW